jgi:hypothetical protein
MRLNKSRNDTYRYRCYCSSSKCAMEEVVTCCFRTHQTTLKRIAIRKCFLFIGAQRSMLPESRVAV